MIETKTFPEVVRFYHDNNIVFRSAKKDAHYAISDLRDEGFTIDRLSANERVRCTFGLYETKLAELRAAGGRQAYDEFGSSTIAIRSALIQGPDLAISAKRDFVLDLADEARAVDCFCEILASLRSAMSYKPAILSCVLVGVESGELTENKIEFNWLVPRFIAKMHEVGQEVGADQAAEAFIRLDRTFQLPMRVDKSDRGQEERQSPNRPQSAIFNQDPFSWFGWGARRLSHRTASPFFWIPNFDSYGLICAARSRGGRRAASEIAMRPGLGWLFDASRRLHGISISRRLKTHNGLFLTANRDSESQESLAVIPRFPAYRRAWSSGARHPGLARMIHNTRAWVRIVVSES